jgi:hypothetical protein
MFSHIEKFLSNDLDLSTINANIGYRSFDKLTIIYCNLTFTVERYVAEMETAHDTIVLDFHDHYYYGDLSQNTYNYNNVSDTLDAIITVSRMFPNKNIVLLTENQFTVDELKCIQPPNLSIVVSPYHPYSYDEIDNIIRNVVNDKFFTQPTHVMCLNNNPRPHRVGIVLYLMYLKLSSIYITFMSYERWNNCSDYNSDYNHATILSYLYPYSKLYDRLDSINLADTFKDNADYVYQDTISDVTTTNTDNFKNKLKGLYQTSIIEIVTETTSLENTAQMTEKFIHCIIGRCFPIIIGTYRNVELYRNMGYDMFDDIIDHSYDYEPNPFYRLKMAIDLNIDILTNKDLAISLYSKNRMRLDNNIENYIKQYDIILADTIGDLDAELAKFGI